ncbi:MAG: LysM peptidoglycan-binding domain-containing protein [Kiritimatiellia bacterium]
MKMKIVSQRSIAKMLKTGKPLAGLLVGLSYTLATAAEREMPGPAVMGAPEPIASATNKVSEACGVAVRSKMRIGSPAATMGLYPSPGSVTSYRVAEGDTLTKIAKRFATTVEELKRLNGFDDARANALKAGEMIRVAPDPKPRQRPSRKPVQKKEEPAVPDNSDNETDGLITDGDVIMGDFD